MSLWLGDNVKKRTAIAIPSRFRGVAVTATIFACFMASSAFAAPQPTPNGSCAEVKNPAARKGCETARAEYAKGNYRLSLALMSKALDTSPKEPILRVQIARIFIRFESLGRAEEQLRRARKEGAPDQVVLPVLLYVMVARHEEEILLNEFPEPAANAKDSLSAIILKGRAQALQSLGRLAEAASAMDRSLSLRRDADGLRFRSEIATQQKDLVLAKKLVQEAYALAPTDALVMFAQLEQLQKANDFAGALALSERMIKLYPVNSDPREARIQIFLKQNQDAKAKAEVDAFLALRPRAPLGNFYKAVLLRRAHDAKGAAQIIQALPPEFLKGHPEYALQMADIMLDIGSVGTATGMLGMALGAAPDMLDVRLRLAGLRMSENSPQSAMVLLTPVKDLPDPRVQKLLAQVRARIAKDRAF